MLCKIWGVQCGDYEECRLLGYKNSVHTSQETHYVSATEPRPLMVCKIWGFHVGNDEECSLLGYKNPIRTSQETYYISTAESSQFNAMQDLRFSRRWLCRISSSGILHRVVLIITCVSEERIASIVRVTRIGELGTTLAVIFSSQRCSVASYCCCPSAKQ
jgi:hypothetical protein